MGCLGGWVVGIDFEGVLQGTQAIYVETRA